MPWRRSRSVTAPCAAEVVTFLYQALLGRAPSEAELVMRASIDTDQLVRELMTAPELDAHRADAARIGELFELLLRRAPTADEVHTHQGTLVGRVVEAILVSEEHRVVAEARSRAESAPARANVWTASTAPWTHEVGTTSTDGVAVVGKEGYMFLRAGSNSLLEQYLGRLELPRQWSEQWMAMLDERRRRCAALGVTAAQIVVPDKLAALPEHFPDHLVPEGRRPVERLLDLGAPLTYPLEALTGCSAAYLRTDSHLGVEGNRVMYEVTCEALGIEPPPVASATELSSYFSFGDLGRRFAPRVGEQMACAPPTTASIAEDNRGVVAATGGHIGTRRVWRNPASARPETVVLFGDSYGFGDPVYLGLAWWLAEAFACVHFVWVPFGFDERYVRETGASLVVMQTAERFIVRVPRPQVDVEDLVRRAEASAHGLDPTSAFGG